MLTLLLNRNLGGRGIAGGASVGAPVVSVGVTNLVSSGGGGARHFGAYYEYNDPAVLAIKEEVKALKEEKKEVKQDDGKADLMLDAINERLRYLQDLLKKKREAYKAAQDSYDYQQEAIAKAKRAKKEKRMRRARAIMRLLNED